MSAKLVGLVMEADLPRPEKFVLIVLADHAKEDGSDVYPSVSRIEWKTGYGERQVRQIMGSLQERKILILVKQGGKGAGDSNKYRIDPGAIAPLTPFREWCKQQGKIDDVSLQNSHPEGAELRVQFFPNKGAVSAPESKTITKNLFGNSLAELPQNQKPKPKTRDPRFSDVCEAIRKCWPKGRECDITPADAGAITRMLATRESWSAEELAICIAFRFLSDEVNPTESIKAWIGAITDYASGPQNKFGKPRYREREIENIKHQARVMLYGAQPPQKSLKQLPSDFDSNAGNLLWASIADATSRQMAKSAWIRVANGLGIWRGILFVCVPDQDFRSRVQGCEKVLNREIDGSPVRAIRFLTEQEFNSYDFGEEIPA